MAEILARDAARVTRAALARWKRAQDDLEAAQRESDAATRELEYWRERGADLARQVAAETPGHGK